MKTAHSTSRLLMLGLTTFSVLAFASNASAVLLAYDGFNYTSGPVTGKGGGPSDFGFTGAWYNLGVHTSGNIAATGLSRSPLESSGGAADLSTSTTPVTTGANFRNLSRSFTDVTDSETWVSLLVQKSGASANNLFNGISFYGGGTENANTEWAISTAASGANQEWRVQNLNNGGASNSVGTGTFLEVGRTDLLLAQVVWNPSGTETLNLWVNPSTSAGVAGLGTPASLNLTIASFDRFRIAAQNGGPYLFDEIRIGDTFSDVLPMIPANPDLDGNGVGISDFNLIRNNFLTLNTHAMGDANFDGFVDHADYFVWREAFLSGGGSLSAISWSPVPEPSSIVLAGVALCGGVAIARRRRHRA